MEKLTYLESNSTKDLASIYMAHYYSFSWLWGTPEALSDDPETLRHFINTTSGIEFIQSSGIVKIIEIDEEEAETLTKLLRNPRLVIR